MVPDKSDISHTIKWKQIFANIKGTNQSKQNHTRNVARLKVVNQHRYQFGYVGFHVLEAGFGEISQQSEGALSDLWHIILKHVYCYQLIAWHIIL